MSNPLFTINAEGVDVDKLMSDIQAAVARKTEQGLYRDVRIAQAERANLSALKDDESFLTFYLECLREAVYVDINDFEIREHRPYVGSLLVGLKRTIWKILKFYTYRLWSQQNQVNGLLVTAVEGMEDKYRKKISDLEERIEKLEGEPRKDGTSCRPPDA